jgi:hypothetical protein
MQQAVKLLESQRLRGQHPWEQFLSRSEIRQICTRPDSSSDILFDALDVLKPIKHPDDPDRMNGRPRVHYGTIGSSNTLLKAPQVRDRLREMYAVKAIEMEGSGIAAATWLGAARGYLLIRGICDYCDSHKNDLWQPYAACAAAAYAAALIASIPQGALRALEPLLDERVLMRNLRALLVKHFSLGELEILCSDVTAELAATGIDEVVTLDRVGGVGTEQVGLRLIEYLVRRGYLDYLVRELRRARPNVGFFVEMDQPRST